MFLLQNADAQLAQQAGYDRPVSLSHGVKALIDRAVADPAWLNDWNGVLWDILKMSLSPLGQIIPEDHTAVRFGVIITGLNGLRPGEADLEDHVVALVCHCGPAVLGKPEPGFTVMTVKEYQRRQAFNYWLRSGRFGWVERSLN